jgi:hypothetical protein
MACAQAASTRTVDVVSWWLMKDVTSLGIRGDSDGADGRYRGGRVQSADVGRSLAAELGEPLGTLGGRTDGLADDPGIDPARVLDGQRGPRWAILDWIPELLR